VQDIAQLDGQKGKGAGGSEQQQWPGSIGRHSLFLLAGPIKVQHQAFPVAAGQLKVWRELDGLAGTGPGALATEQTAVQVDA
jgi:hypothetical protein